MLRHKRPVMFVFDVSETEGQQLPPEVEKPFGISAGKLNGQYEKITENCKRDAIKTPGSRI